MFVKFYMGSSQGVGGRGAWPDPTLFNSLRIVSPCCGKDEIFDADRMRDVRVMECHVDRSYAAWSQSSSSEQGCYHSVVDSRALALQRVMNCASTDVPAGIGRPSETIGNHSRHVRRGLGP